jgi:co-chaperonin GroES (HSP10)
MAIKFTPLHDRILVRRIEEAGTTRGGLIIPRFCPVRECVRGSPSLA